MKTINELFDISWELHWNKTRFQQSTWAREVLGSFKKRISPVFGHRRIDKLTPKIVRDWHRGMEATPIAANRALEVLSKMYGIAQEEEIIPLGANPCSFVKAFTEKKRSRYATETELKRICSVLDRYYPTRAAQVAFLYAILYTGARPSSLERALRTDLEIIDGGWGKLVFDGKSTADSGEKETVLFPPRIVQLILNAKRIPGVEKLFWCKMPSAFWNRVRVEAECPDLWARDLRRTFATIGLSSGVGIDVIGAVLNHASSQTTKTYAKLNDQARTRAVSAVAEKLELLQKV